MSAECNNAVDPVVTHVDVSAKPAAADSDAPLIADIPTAALDPAAPPVDFEASPEATAYAPEPTYSEASGSDVPSPAPVGPSLHDLEAQMVGADILFSNNSLDAPADTMTNLKWLATNGVRRVRFCGNVSRLTVEKKGLFGLRTADVYHARKLAIYDYPSMMLILRAPQDAAEIALLLDIPPETDVGDVSSYLVAETVLDPKACKLRLSTLTTPTSIENTSVDPRRRTCFELVSPTENILLSCIPSNHEPNHMSFVNSVAFLETKKMEVAVGNALHDAHSPSDKNSDVTWKHQLILGTLHSYVIGGSQSLLEQAICAAADGNRVSSHVIDGVDESGRTALHYACARRNAAAVTALIGAGCDATIRVDESATPCHLSAAMLDERSLSTILSATFPRRPDPNALDGQGRTPMYVAALEGSSGIEKDDPMALGRCLQALEVWDGQMLVKGSLLPHPVVVLSSGWQYVKLTAVLGHVPFRYPLPTSGISVGALYHYPIHTAIVSLRRRVLTISPGDKDFRIADSERLSLMRTLNVLLEHGFEPNERIEGSMQAISVGENVAQFFGFTPIQILAATALDLVALKATKIGIGVEDCIANMIAACVDRLLRSGARLSLEIPPLSRLSRPSLLPPKPESSLKDDRASLKVESNKDIFNIFGGDIRMKPAKKLWFELRTVPSTGKTFIQQDIKKAETPDSDAPGGSDEKSCAICWAVFGMIMNRKHRCRVSQRYVCEDCSTKRILEGKDEHRLSDGQFVLAQADDVKQRQDRMKKQTEEVRARKAELTQRQAQRQAKIDDEKAKKDSLFGGMMEQLGFVEEDNGRDAINSLHNTLGQTRDALNERGDKLNSLSDKTEKLMEASGDFERMAKELAASQKGGFFW
jgi:FYVE zinc finger